MTQDTTRRLNPCPNCGFFHGASGPCPRWPVPDPERALQDDKALLLSLANLLVAVMDNPTSKENPDFAALYESLTSRLGRGTGKEFASRIRRAAMTLKVMLEE